MPLGDMLFPFGETVEVLKAGWVEDPFSGELVLDWSQPSVHPVPVPVAVYASMVAESNEPGAIMTPLLVLSTLTVFMPYETDVQEVDRVRILTGSFASLYEVKAVKKWRHPMTGWTPGTEVRILLGSVSG